MGLLLGSAGLVGGALLGAQFNQWSCGGGLECIGPGLGTMTGGALLGAATGATVGVLLTMPVTGGRKARTSISLIPGVGRAPSRVSVTSTF